MNMTVVIRSVVTLCVAFVLASVVWRASDTVITQAVSSDWPRANGYVRQSQVVASDANPFIDDLELEYTYQIGTEWVVGDRLTFYGQGLSMLLRVGSPDNMAADFAEGSAIEVAYDPANPRRGVLIPGITGVEFGAAAFLIVGIGGIAIGMLTHACSALMRELSARNAPQGDHRQVRTPDLDSTQTRARAA